MDVRKDGARSFRATMLREVNHRAKNMLQLVSSILILEIKRADNEEARNAIARAAHRLQSMSHVHSMLYLTGDETDRIQMDTYLKGLCGAISTGFFSGRGSLKCNVSSVGFLWPMEVAGQIGMIVSETLINSCKHAFEPSMPAAIGVRLDQLENGDFRLDISDNGRGFDVDRTGHGVGTTLLRTFAKNLDGTLDVESQPGVGTRVLLVFPANALEPYEEVHGHSDRRCESAPLGNSLL